MEDKKKKNVMRLVFILLNISFLAAAIDIISLIFRSLHTKLFDVYKVNIFHINGLDFNVIIPAWPILLLIAEATLYLICLRLLYKYIRILWKAQSKNIK